MSVVIKIENLRKEYRLGVIGYGTLYRDLQSWWSNVRGKPDPNSLLGMADLQSGKDRILALDDINLEVNDGEVLGIIGANGAGKSTLLKILSHITSPTAGSIKYRGRIASLLEVGTGFHPELTGRENIYLNGAINGMEKLEISRKLDEIVAFSGVEKYLDTPVKRYSSGMYVRLGFSVAAYLDPDILVVDEVLAVGDAKFQKKAIGQMKKVSSEKGRTVLFVSHNMVSIETLCNQAILLDKGKIVFRGDASSTIDRYLQGKSDQKLTKVDLTSHDGRKKGKTVSATGKKIFQSIELLDKRNKNSSVFEIGDTILFRIKLNNSVVDYDSPNIMISIYDRSDTMIISLNTSQMNFKIKDRGFVNFQLDNCRLTPGYYSVHLNYKSTGKNLMSDAIRDAITFRILDKAFKSGVSFHKDSQCVAEGKWDFNK